MACPIFAARVLLTIASFQGIVLSLFDFELSMGVAMDLGKVIYFTPSLEMPLGSIRCSVLPGIFTVCPS